MFAGKHRTAVSRETFKLCQDILNGRNRRKSTVNLPLAGGLFVCKYCGQAITGERIRKRLKGGGVNEHVYYRCGNDEQDEAHPKLRWKAHALEAAVLAQLNTLKLPDESVTAWFRTSLRAALADEAEFNRRNQAQLRKRESELQNQSSRLLDVFLSGTIDKQTYEAKNVQIREELESVRGKMARETKVNEDFIQMAEKAFDFAQDAAKTWLGSNSQLRRELLQILSLNRELDEASLYVTWAKPFDSLANQAVLKDNRGDRI